MERERKVKTWEWLVLVTFALLCVIATVEAETLTEQDAIRIALQNNHTLANSVLESQKTEAQTAAARTHRFPTVELEVLGAQQVTDISFKFDKGEFGTYPGIGPVPYTDTVISTPSVPTATIMGTIQQPLTQLYQIDLKVKQLELSEQIAQQDVRRVRQELVSEVRQAYYGIQQTQSSLKSAEEVVALYRELDRVTDQYLVQQVVLKSDSIDMKMRAAKAENDVFTLVSDLVVAKQKLNSLLNRDIMLDFDVESEVANVTDASDLDTTQKAALNQRPELKQAQLKVQQAQLDRRVKKSEYIPDLGVQFQYTSLQNFDDFLPSSYGSVGLELKWEVFDWGRKSKELAEKTLAIHQAENQERDTRNSIVTDVTDKFFKLQESRRLVEIARLSHEAASENARVFANRFKVQSAILKDVLQAQTALEQSNSQYQQSLLALRAAQAEFEKARGEEQ